MHDDIYLSVVIPAYNEETNIAETLAELNEYLGNKGFHYEVIVVDDGSSDMTVTRAKESGKSLERLIVIESKPNMGKGYALKKGMLKAQGQLVLFMDADNSTSIKMLDKFTPFFGEEHDIYIASRRLKGAEVEVPFERRALGVVYIMLARLILGIKVSDINCGFKIYRREVAHNIFSRQIMNDWSFDAEDLFLAGKKKCLIKEVPVEWEHKYTSKVKPIMDGIKSFISLANIRGNDIRGKYDNVGKRDAS